MSKLNCDVIADLMPSYVDDICCDETKTLVDEHLAECEKCTEKITIMKNTIIVADTANQNEFNYMKKIEKCFNKKNAMYFAMLLFVIVVCAFVFFNKLGSVPLSMYYIILPILLFGAYFFSANTTGKKSISKFTVAVGILCFVLIFYTIFIEFSISNWMKTGVYPFGLPPHKVGPFISYQLLVIGGILLTVFLGTTFAILKTGYSHILLLTSSITGVCISFSFISLMSQLNDISYFATLRTSSVFAFLSEGIFLATCLYLLERRKIRHQYIHN